MNAYATLVEQLRNWIPSLRSSEWSRISTKGEEPPLRAALFSAEQMALHGKALAATHALARGHAPDQLLARLAANETALISVCKLLTEAVTAKRRVSPGGAWLLDNFYLIEDQIRTTKRHLPKGYSRELPRLLQGPSAGRPRVYDIALQVISHGDGRVDADSLSRFVAAYQSVTPLKLGELWAIPIMLRLAVIENLRRVGVRIAAGWDERNLADTWADQMTETAEQNPRDLILVIADMARSNPPMVSAFVAELARRLQGRGPALALPLTWIAQRLSESGLTIEQLVQLENQQQAADQVSISNSIGSLRVLGAMDWRDFVESLSIVEQTLRADPAGVYPDMAFATRDRYRHATEAIAKRGNFSEGEVANAALAMARAGATAQQGGTQPDRTAHVGYYLAGKGLPALEQAAGARLSFGGRLRRKARQWPLALYLGTITAVTLLLTALLLLPTRFAALPHWWPVWLPVPEADHMALWWWLPLAALSLLAISQLAAALVNWLVTLLVAPTALPRMDYSEGIPASARTLVVIPTMLTGAASIEDLIEALEVRFLANRDDNLHFGLLTDLRDAPQQTMPGDEALVTLAQLRINELNAKYASTPDVAAQIFFLFHRARSWNAQANQWMGYERKRGKLADLNALLRASGVAEGSKRFAVIVGNIAPLRSVKYVITLDTDTALPLDAARQMVAAMAHPLNRPQYDVATQSVVDGYGILQPRVAATLQGTHRSRYARMYSGDVGIDPYTRAVSDVYQDVFAEGSFIGKGIYDVDAFEFAVGERFPENRILSHDLLEGCYARAGLLSDVQLYEDYPPRYGSDVSRRHRWIRGDWQLAGWLLRGVPADGARRQRNPLSALSQWKLFDNLRRSLVPAALMLMLVLGWTVLAPAGLWTAAVLAIVLLPSLCAMLLDFLRKPAEALLVQHVSASAQAAVRRTAQLGYEFACLPYEAYYSLDAIGRTVWRMLVSHRHLLEWQTSADSAQPAGRGDFVATLRQMWVAPALALAIALYLVATSPGTLLIAVPILLLWLLAPVLAWWISRPLAQRQAALTAVQTRFLRMLSRRTWAFFDHFVGPDDHWLPPDNYQEYRVAAVAHRTSPTNMGLALLANLSAYDFGYVLSGPLLERTANTLRTMASLERHRGHFYNWYDTQTLQALAPLYISTVDSGNLAGHLLTLRPGLLALLDDSILPPQLYAGLSDPFQILLDTADASAAAAMAMFWNEQDCSFSTQPVTLQAAFSHLQRLASCADALAEKVAATAPATLPAGSQNANHEQAALQAAKTAEVHEWAQALARQCHDAVAELAWLAPWLLQPAAPDTLTQALAGFGGLNAIPTLYQLSQLVGTSAAEIDALLGAHPASAEQAWLAALQQNVQLASQRADTRIACIAQLAAQAGEMARMDYDFLYDKTRHLLTIGYNVSDHRADASYYDLLASEARLGCFVAIAQGHLPQESWFALGRLLTGTGGDPVLLSWSGSMFEYLMPLLVMPGYDNTLLDQTCKAAVARQIEYGRQRGVPWGISESGYNTVDVSLDYQYRAFGVPGLGLKRGLAEDLVIAPYATVMALMVAPEAACQNLQRMADRGFVGKYGFFEAIDYTATRQRRGQSHAVVRSFMVHHQGMSLLALDYLLLDKPMQQRFASDRLFQAAMLLLQERIPKATGLFAHTAQRFDVRSISLAAEPPMRLFTTPDTAQPEVQLLSNGRYHVMVSNAGGGYSRWKDLAVTRWQEDGTSDHWGSFCYIRDVSSGAFWSTSHQPTLAKPAHYEAIFSEGRAEFRRRDVLGEADGGNAADALETHTEIVVSPEDDIELRRIRITNRSRQRREIDVTTYGEVVIAPADGDAQHPAFSKLFVQTEILQAQHAILCTRRPRAVGDAAPWLLHLMTVHGAEIGTVSYETDRARFIGRNRTLASPLAMHEPGALSNTDGSVLDPVVAIRYRIVLEAEQTATLDVVSGMAENRELALGLIDRYQDRHLADRVFDLAWTHSQVALRQLNATEADAQLYARLASAVIYANATLRADASVLIQNRRGQSGLWGYAISGDLPIVLLQVSDAANIDLVRQMVQAHAYWRLRGLVVDLVIWNEDHAGYRQRLQDQILGLIASGIEASVIDRPGGIFVRLAEQISGEDRTLFQAVARAVISDERGTLVEQLDDRKRAEPRVAKLVPTRAYRAENTAPLPRRELVLFNGLGGFTRDGHEYVMTLMPGQVTPAPWVNVLANPLFGTVVSEAGSAYSWHENAHEFRLSPWQNDPVSDGNGEAIYLRDDETGHVWSPAPFPARADVPYVVRHGFGYSVFETTLNGIRSELWVYVAMDAAIKFSVLKLFNESGRARLLSATGYVQWVLGDLGAKTAMHLNTEIDPGTGALFARNPYSNEFAGRVAFFDVDDPGRTLTGDRNEFIGRNGQLRQPAALARTHLSGKTGAGLDPCGAIQSSFALEEGETREVVFRLGVGNDTADAGKLVQQFRGEGAALRALENVWQHWNHALGAIKVETPNVAVNVLANGWLVYQTLACRIWARSGYYQSGGAFGFRDQLQDMMSLIHAKPALVREHLLLSASRQFVEGDVQHWWHPPAGRGVRTHCSDDYLWLPLAVCRYVTGTGDTGVLDEHAHFLEGRPVNAEDDSYYDMPGRSADTASLYEHCVRAIRHGLRFGERGLPLIGSGDWNDGMNLVGMGGKGESIWLGFFLCEVLRQFAGVAQTRGDQAFADECTRQAEQLRQNIERNGWDGAWYRRAYFDDGTPLGSAGNAECQIDSISQSWSVLSGAGDPTRARRAMQAVDERLVRKDDALVQLLDPPFNQSSLNPGYIRGYVPGVRENGGQYTHGAVWAAMAFAELGENERAWALLAMINPVNHALSPAAAARYKVEPYVVAADVYGVAPHTGRGGWSWYTGSAGWMYRLIVESLLGLKLQGETLHLAPRLPADWPWFKLHYRYRNTVYHITVTQTQSGDASASASTTLSVDGVPQQDTAVQLQDDHGEHMVEVGVRAS
ncbi:N,N'-diacetylchitobiose phosphorylase [Andreprevotia sp. IGB-42]|nr:N,N'-diacetylchitobiose phosphorylase [Andreprevotia sp. IGB-42]